MLNKTEIFIPLKIKIIIWKKKKFKEHYLFYLINESKKISFYTKNNNFYIDKWSNSLLIENKNINFELNRIGNYINKFLKSWDIYFFKKIKFKGKGFRIRFFKKLKLIKLFFGKSHKTFYFIKKINLKRLNKYKFIISNINNNKVNVLAKNIVNIKKINFYTLRGLRISRQTIYKRKGKKGTYI